MLVGGRVSLKSVEPLGRLAIQRLWKEVHLLVRRERKDIHELDGMAAVRRCHDAPCEQLVADPLGQPA